MRNLFPTISKEASSAPLPVSASVAFVSSWSEAERVAATACGVFSGMDACEAMVMHVLVAVVSVAVAMVVVSH